MNNFYSVEQIPEATNLDATLNIRQYKLDLMSTNLEIKSKYPELTQKQTAQQLEYSDFTMKRHKDQIKMPSPDNRKNAQRKTMSSEEGSKNKKVENLRARMRLFLVKI